MLSHQCTNACSATSSYARTALDLSSTIYYYSIQRSPPSIDRTVQTFVLGQSAVLGPRDVAREVPPHVLPGRLEVARPGRLPHSPSPELALGRFGARPLAL